MSLEHDFLLLDRELDGDSELSRFIHDPRAVHLHDDFVRYLSDTLSWIPTFNPSRREPHCGLCMWGMTTIEAQCAPLAERVFRGWAELLALGPAELSLTGNFAFAADSGEPAPVGERVTQLEGGYHRLSFDRDETVRVLRQLAAYSRAVANANGRLYILHIGV